MDTIYLTEKVGLEQIQRFFTQCFDNSKMGGVKIKDDRAQFTFNLNNREGSFKTLLEIEKNTNKDLSFTPYLIAREWVAQYGTPVIYFDKSLAAGDSYLIDSEGWWVVDMDLNSDKSIIYKKLHSIV
jgi:hypothetical protein